MADEPDSLVLRYLRRIDEKVDRLGDDVRDLKIRMTAMEERFAGTERGLALINGRLDRVEERLERIERRLDLVES